MSKKYNICVVCYANFCRSPVAERILKEHMSSEFNISSAGINPLTEANMDKRSFDFLESININPGIHNPNKIDLKVINNSDLIIPLDAKIMMSLQRKFNFTKKMMILNFYEPSKIIYDPYRFNDNDYHKLMKRLLRVSINFANKFQNEK